MQKTVEVSDKLIVLAKTASLLNEHAVTWALGSGAMLYLNGIVETFGDLDIMVSEEDIEKLKSLLPELGEQSFSSPKAKFKTKYFYELTREGVELDIMAEMAIVKEGVEYACPLRKEFIEGSVSLFGEKIYLYSVSEWQRFYSLMGRTEKAALIETTLKAKALLPNR